MVCGGECVITPQQKATSRNFSLFQRNRIQHSGRGLATVRKNKMVEQEAAGQVFIHSWEAEQEVRGLTAHHQ